MVGLFALKPLLLALTISSPMPQAEAETGMFPDVPQNHWAYAAVYELKQKGILRGYPGGAFQRAQASEKNAPEKKSVAETRPASVTPPSKPAG